MNASSNNNEHGLPLASGTLLTHLFKSNLDPGVRAEVHALSFSIPSPQKFAQGAFLFIYFLMLITRNWTNKLEIPKQAWV